jgi:N-acetylornithine carbamoyltransferase
MNNFLSLADAGPGGAQALVDLARSLEREPRPDVLAGKVLGLLFLNPSLRTLASFQAGMARLGGSSFVITPDTSWELEFEPGVPMTGAAAEHVREAIPVLASYADALGLRAFARGEDLGRDLAEPVLNAVAEVCPVPLVNMESAFDHPCQALADWKTLDDLDVPAGGGRFVLSWARHPRALPQAVPAAVVRMAAMRGMDVTVLRPEGFGLPPPMMAEAAALASASGGSLRETDDREAALDGAHMLYAKSWTATDAYGAPEAEAALRAGCRDWTVDEDWFAPAAPDCGFMHCLPVRREVVVTGAVLEGPRSRVIAQARNRMYAQMAVLCRLLGKGDQAS